MRLPKSGSAEEAVKLIRSGDEVTLATFSGVPRYLPNALMERAQELKGVRIFHMTPFVSNVEKKLLEPGMEKHIRCLTPFCGRRESVRRLVKEGRADFYSISFAQYPEMLRTGDFKCDVFMLTVTPPDRFGYCSMGVSVDIAWGALERPARLVLAEINPNMPRTHGRTFIHESRIDYAVEVNDPIFEMGQSEITDAEKKIGQYVADIVEDGATLQIGYGGVSEAAIRFLDSKKDLGVHTEMVPEGMRTLVESGVINNSKKSIHRDKIVCTFHGGTRQLFDWLDDNPLIEMHGVDYVNDPNVIAKNYKMTAINAALQVDLFGNVYADVLGVNDQYTGSGGQLDYVKGCAISPGAKFINTLPSISTNQEWSRIVSHPTMTENAIAPQMPLFSRYFADYIVTEYGVAQLKGKSNRQKAESLIAIAHPKFRGMLQEQAETLGLLEKK